MNGVSVIFYSGHREYGSRQELCGRRVVLVESLILGYSTFMRTLTRSGVLFLIAPLCWHCGGNPCKSGGEPFLEIGQGDTLFATLEPEGTVMDLVYGPQGGYHLTMALRGGYFDATSFMGVTLIGSIEGENQAETNHWLNMECGSDKAYLEATNTLLIFNDGLTPEALQGKEVEVEATLVDYRGVRVKDTVNVLISEVLIDDSGQ